MSEPIRGQFIGASFFDPDGVRIEMTYDEARAEIVKMMREDGLRIAVDPLSRDGVLVWLDEDGDAA